MITSYLCSYKQTKQTNEMKRKIAIIAGHSGAGTGANGFIDEGKETIRLRDAVVARLKGATAFEVITDRDNDRLPVVVAFLRKLLAPADILIDIHFNASPARLANGTQVFIPEKSTAVELELAGILQKEMSKFFKNRGVGDERDTYHKKIAMLSDVNTINLLLEVCFVTNENDAKIYTKRFDEIADTIANFVKYVAAKY